MKKYNSLIIFKESLSLAKGLYMSDKEKKEQQLLNLLQQQVGKGRPMTESLRKIKSNPQKDEMDKIFGQFIFDTTPDDLIIEIENNRSASSHTEF